MAAALNSSTYRNTVELRESEMISSVHRDFLSPVDHSDRTAPSPYLLSTVSGIPPKFRVRFPGSKLPGDEWKAWTHRMQSLHGHVWKKAGIRKAILNSCCEIDRNTKVISGFAEKWSSSTNTFVFPWGEATVTLEDMLVVGGYPVLGAPVFTSVDPDSDLMAVQRELESERRKLNRSSSHKALQSQWMKRFMGTESPIEHEAYLALWLSRFVFPKTRQNDTIGSHVISLAVLLARGETIALAPAVLAGIYASLTEMKDAIVRKSPEVAVSAPLQLLQIWIWERFPAFRPNPVLRTVKSATPWFRRWHGSTCSPPRDVTKAIDDASGSFSWRPYFGKRPKGRFDNKTEMVLISPDMEQGAKILIRCLRHSELVGMDGQGRFFMKQYLPHRVALQFGYDQDVPAPVPRFASDKVEAWNNYSRRVEDEWLYVPAGLHRGGVSARYQRWWNGLAP